MDREILWWAVYYFAYLFAMLFTAMLVLTYTKLGFGVVILVWLAAILADLTELKREVSRRE